MQEQGYIYLLEADNHLKLRFSTDIKSRIKTLQRWEGEISLVTYCLGSLAEEMSLHKRLSEGDDYCEWYPLSRKREILEVLRQFQIQDNSRLVKQEENHV